MRWIKTSDRLPKTGDLYFVKVKELNQDDSDWFPDTCNFYDEWQMSGYEYIVLEWLDEERIDPGFVDYMNAAKDEFVAFINKQDWNNELRTNAESFIIAYDQIAERLVKAVG